MTEKVKIFVSARKSFAVFSLTRSSRVMNRCAFSRYFFRSN